MKCMDLKNEHNQEVIQDICQCIGEGLHVYIYMYRNGEAFFIRFVKTDRCSRK